MSLNILKPMFLIQTATRYGAVGRQTALLPHYVIQNNWAIQPLSFFPMTMAMAMNQFSLLGLVLTEQKNSSKPPPLRRVQQKA